MGGPIFGASGKINVAYFDALQSMSKMALSIDQTDTYSGRAKELKSSIVQHLWNADAGILRMSDITSPDGVCQDINAYGITTGISPVHDRAKSLLVAPGDTTLPLAFQKLERWDQKKVISPYASGFAAEALFERNHGSSAIELIDRVWGVMADESNPNYSGGHWEAMKPDGTPANDDTSLMHGWSTWPVYLLPRYLGGLQPLEPGWTSWMCKPVLAGLESIQVELSTPLGDIKASLHIKESAGTGEVILNVPVGTVAEFVAPEGWTVSSPESDAGSKQHTFSGQKDDITIKIIKV